MKFGVVIIFRTGSCLIIQSHSPGGATAQQRASHVGLCHAYFSWCFSVKNIPRRHSSDLVHNVKTVYCDKRTGISDIYLRVCLSVCECVCVCGLWVVNDVVLLLPVLWLICHASQHAFHVTRSCCFTMLTLWITIIIIIIVMFIWVEQSGESLYRRFASMTRQ